MKEDEKTILQEWRGVLKEFLDPLDMMKHMHRVFQINTESYAQVYSERKNSHVAVDVLIDELLKGDMLFEDFISAIRKCKHEWLATLVSGEIDADEVEKAILLKENINHVRHFLTSISSRIKDVIIAIDVAECLKYAEIISEDDNEKIVSEKNNYGNRAAVNILLSILMRKPPRWWESFAQVIADLGYDYNLVDSLKSLTFKEKTVQFASDDTSKPDPGAIPKRKAAMAGNLSPSSSHKSKNQVNKTALRKYKKVVAHDANYRKDVLICAPTGSGETKLAGIATVPIELEDKLNYHMDQQVKESTKVNNDASEDSNGNSMLKLQEEAISSSRTFRVLCRKCSKQVCTSDDIKIFQNHFTYEEKSFGDTFIIQSKYLPGMKKKRLSCDYALVDSLKSLTFDEKTVQFASGDISEYDYLKETSARDDTSDPDHGAIPKRKAAMAANLSSSSSHKTKKQVNKTALRKYQKVVAHDANYGKDVLICSPTGSGETKVAGIATVPIEFEDKLNYHMDQQVKESTNVNNDASRDSNGNSFNVVDNVKNARVFCKICSEQPCTSDDIEMGWRRDTFFVQSKYFQQVFNGMELIGLSCAKCKSSRAILIRRRNRSSIVILLEEKWLYPLFFLSMVLKINLVKSI